MTRKQTVFVPKTPPRCCGKNQYQSRQEAQLVADEQMMINQTVQLSVYACICGCKGWHLTRDSGDPDYS